MTSALNVDRTLSSLSASQRQLLLHNLLASFDDGSPAARAAAFSRAYQSLPRIVIMAPPPAAVLAGLSTGIFLQVQGMHDRASTGIQQLRQGPVAGRTTAVSPPFVAPSPSPTGWARPRPRTRSHWLLVAAVAAPVVWLVVALIGAQVTRWSLATAPERQQQLSDEIGKLRREAGDLDKRLQKARPTAEATRAAEIELGQLSDKLSPSVAIPDGFDVPTGDKNAFGHPVVIRDGSRTDAETGLPLEIVHRATGIVFVWIPPGEFEMGARDGETDSSDDERPRHRVQISRGFWVSRYEITQGQYQQVLGKNPSDFSAGGGSSGKILGLDTSRFPVENVDWNDCIAFANKLGEQETPVRAAHYRINNTTVEIAGGDGYRLLTEAEWEYVARAGTTTIFPWGDSLSSEQANFNGNSPYGGAGKGKYLARTAPVGSYPANPWGLYDTAGNVWEWVWDRYGADEYKQFDGQEAVDPQGPAQGVNRVLRGGSWIACGLYCRPAFRFRFVPGIRFFRGFRLALG